MADLANEGRGGAVGVQLAAGGRGAGGRGSPRAEGGAPQTARVRPRQAWAPSGAHPTMASGSRPGSSRQPRRLPLPGLESPEPRRDRHPRPSRLARRPGSPTGRSRGSTASGRARPQACSAAQRATLPPFPAPLAWGPGLRPRPGLRPSFQSSHKVLHHSDLWLASRALLNPEPGAHIPATGFHALWGAPDTPPHLSLVSRS